jgi:hypothetical protein
MKASELRIGNYYNQFGNETKISWVNLKELESAPEGQIWCKPIDLTDEWLLRFGFEKKGHGFSDNIYYKQQEWANWAYSVTISETGMVIKHGFMNQWSELKALNYVHELQNLYFALTGEELTIHQ